LTTIVAMPAMLPDALAEIQAGNPELFLKLLRRLQLRPHYGTITLHFQNGKLTHLKTEVLEK